MTLEEHDEIFDARNLAVEIESMADMIATSLNGAREGSALRGLERLAASLGEKLTAITDRAAT